MLEAKILLMCDDAETANIWTYCLRQRNLQVFTAHQFKAALELWLQEITDLVIIDVLSSKADELAFINDLRAHSMAPILLLSSDTRDSHILKAYKAGVDEVVIKPISPTLFLAKVKAWLRRSWTVQAEALDTLQINTLNLDPVRRQVVLGEKGATRLTNLEFRLLYLLMSHPGRVIATSEIIERVWGHYGDGDSNMLKNLVYRLRRKLDPDQSQPPIIHTEAGLGYKFQPNE